MARRHKRHSKDSFYRTIIVGCYLSMGVNLLLGMVCMLQRGESGYTYMGFLGVAMLICGVIHALSSDRTAHRRDCFSDMLICVVFYIVLTVCLACVIRQWVLLLPFVVESLLMVRFYLRNRPAKK